MKKNLLLSLAVFFLFCFMACNKNEKPPEKELPFSDAAYGKHPRQSLDISLPAGAGKEQPVPIVFCIHGGSWSGGDKKDFNWIRENVNDYGCAYVSINYRLVQDNATYKEMLNDIRSAISYLKENAEGYHLKTDKMCMIGNSAGGHLALLYSYSETSPIPVSCVCSQVGPTDFLDPGQIELNGREKLHLMNRLLGTHLSLEDIDDPDFAFPSAWSLASPVYHVNGHTPPTVLAYGVKDELVSYTNAIRLKDKLEQHGVAHRLITYPNSGHQLNNDPYSSREYWLTLATFVTNYVLR